MGEATGRVLADVAIAAGTKHTRVGGGHHEARWADGGGFTSTPRRGPVGLRPTSQYSPETTGLATTPVVTIE
jgi:hypothetical protein